MDADEYDVLAAVRRKLNVTWESPETEGRVADVVASVSAVLNERLGHPPGHAFTPADGGAWPLFLNGCLYEFSDAMDEFIANYAEDVRAARSLVCLPAEEVADGDQEEG